MNLQPRLLLSLFTLVAWLAWSSAPLRAADPPRLRVLTYNIHHGEGTDGKFDLPRLAKIIDAAKPDLVALQEVDRKTTRASGVDQAAELAKLTGMHAEFGKAMPYAGGEYGEAILSRAKALETKTLPLPSEAGTEPRAALAVRLTPGEGLPELWFIGTHLCHQREPNRLAQAREINKHFPADAKVAAILAGDMNARAGSTTIKEFELLWRDTFPQQRKIDYVLVRKADHWRVVETKVIAEPVASDHDPVLVVLELEK